MLNEEETMAAYIKTGLFVLFMLAIGAVFDPNWAIVTLLSLIYMKRRQK
tara:strand:+ start:187 stop:333 length:147 start_codon:yes stop_codon:yes gene_type:complete